MLHDSRRAARIDVALTTSELVANGQRRLTDVAIVVDVIRATTTLAVLFDQGCRRVLLAPDIQSARTARRSRPDALLAGEVGGAAPEGFDLGNSPAEVSARAVREREVIFATTNGTRALRACAGASATFAGSLRNATAVSRAALASLQCLKGQDHTTTDGRAGAAQSPDTLAEAVDESGEPTILVVCAGRDGRPAYDDTVCAGVLCQRLDTVARDMGIESCLGEGARIALAGARDTHTYGSLRNALAQSDAARAIAGIGLGTDLDWCVAVDASQSTPRLAGVEEPGLHVVEPWSRTEA